jgi:peptidoglycan/xylan/chitin deacetylase (PgdA/CDA1 family)
MTNLELLKRTIKSLGASVLDKTGALDSAWDKGRNWKILMYHRVCNPESASYPIQAGMYVRPETFKLHCEYLKKNANVISVDKLADAVINKETLPKRTIAITFDDGWRDNLENAFPVLKALNLPATIFLPTQFIGTSDLFWTDSIARTQNSSDKLEVLLNELFLLPLEKREARILGLTKNLSQNIQREFLTWEEVESLQAYGVSVGSHSVTHRLFKEISKSEREVEFKESMRVLKEKGLLTSKVFVFPGGSHHEEMEQEYKNAGYLAGLKTTNSFNPDSTILPRIGIHEDISDRIELFKLRVSAS